MEAEHGVSTVVYAALCAYFLTPLSWLYLIAFFTLFFFFLSFSSLPLFFYES